MTPANGLFKSIWEFAPRDNWNKVPGGVRGIYVLFKKASGKRRLYKVVYLGRSTSNVAGRLADHARSKRKKDEWDHFTVFKVHNKVSAKEIAELEQFVLYVFRKDPRTMGLNTQKSTSTLRKIREILIKA